MSSNQKRGEEGSCWESYTDVSEESDHREGSQQENEVDEMNNVQEEIENMEKEDSDSDETYEDELPDLSPVKKLLLYAVGSFLATFYDGHWFVSQVEAEESVGFTLLKYMQRISHKQFVGGTVLNILKIINKDILQETGPSHSHLFQIFRFPKRFCQNSGPNAQRKVVYNHYEILHSFVFETFLHFWNMFKKDTIL
jgi:hypothetical protein